MAGSSDAQALLLQVSADVSRLQKQFDKAAAIVDSGSKKMERRAQQASSNLERFFGKTDPAKALDKVFDATRFRVLDTGVAKIGLMGSALESLGPYGLAAAAAIGAVGAAFAGAREAAKFADDINDTAARLHVTTDALQEYRYAIRAAGGEEKGADEALESFNVTLGKAAAGVPKALKPFQELFGKTFGPAQVKALGDNQHAIEAITKALEGLPDVQKDAVLAQFGLDGLKPLLEGGVTSMQRLREEAHKVGIVMDADLVRRGGDLNDQFETISKVIDVQLKSALVDLGPVLVGILQQMADLAKAAADVADAFRDIEHKRSSRLADLRDEFTARSKTPLTYLFGGPQKDLERAARAQAQIDKNAASEKAPPIKPTRDLIDTNKTPKGASGPRDDTAQRTESINAALAAAARDLLQAQGKLTDDIDARAEVERKIAAEELAQDLARLNKESADLAVDKGFKGDKSIQEAKLEQARIDAKKAAEAKIDLIARQQDWALEDRADDTRRAIRDAEIAQLETASSLATTTAERRRIEEQILKIKQDERDHELGKSLSRLQQTGAISDEESAKRFAAGRANNQGERDQLRVQNAGPLEAFVRANQGADVFLEKLQNIGVQGFDNLADSLAQAAVAGEDLGATLNNVLRQILAQVLSATIKGVGADVGSAILHLIPGFASGTNSAPGGLSLVGERGPELVNLPRGTRVTPSSQTLSALQNLRPISSAVGSSVHLGITVYAEGAIQRSEIENMVRRGSQQAVQQARGLAARDARQGAPAVQRRLEQLGTA
jgi:hypothetical protein